LKDAQYWIDRLELEPHPEGGFFREIYRSEERCRVGWPGRSEEAERVGPAGRFSGPRCLMTSIHYLLRDGQVSRLHRLLADEIWLFHAGTALDLHLLSPDGSYRCEALGPDPEAGQSWQVTVAHGDWIGAALQDPTGYCLVSCLMAPGFEFTDFELGRREELLERYPGQAEIVLELT
jgi:predicted cupin superfamily sugar epimerase